MPVFVHLASHRDLPAIRRSGLRAGGGRHGAPGVYALPVTRNFQVSHQWVRELRRHGGGTIVGIYFRIPDDEIVEVGHYNSCAVTMRAADAVALMLGVERNDPVAARERDKAARHGRRAPALPSSPEGYQAVIARTIAPSEILRIKAVPQVVGWRYMPGANGSPPCGCVCCERGVYGIRKLLDTVERREAAGKPARFHLFGRDDASYDRVERMKAARANRKGALPPR
ncbi:MAG: hypothetical protein ACOY45_11790 [Pseudomonadota bacterium]